ncbi:MAG: cysteine--tRNA ligase [Acidimicrobiia bacterium]
MRIHDTLQGRKVELELREPGRLSMYVCGPTVYDAPHLGHGRTAVVFDTIRRYLEWTGLDVTFVSNVTDVEDKIIARAEREGTSEAEVAAQYESVYWDQLSRLDVRRPDEIPHATAFISQMLELIDELVTSGHAYVVGGQGVYFAVDTYRGYGGLSHRRLADLLETAGARVELDEQKRSPVDFALWKAAKPSEPAWDSPWGPGRPGWHIECSAMSLGLLGEGFDLHGGGDDLVFPHHENERAQAEAAGHRFARHWIHSGMLNVGGEKMSKSLGNFTTLQEALDAHDPRAFRLAVLRTHYRSPIEVGASVLSETSDALDGLDALARRARVAGIEAGAAPDVAAVASFRDAMDDDFNTPAAVAVIFEAKSRANAAIDAGDHAEAARQLATVSVLLDVLGLTLDDGSARSDDADEIDALVAARGAARAARDFVEADHIRDALAARGVTIEDTPAGTIWHR